MKKQVFILDSSTDVTGALKSSLLIAKSLEESCDVCFILPTGTMADKKVSSSGYLYIKMTLPNLKKQVKPIILYIPELILCALNISKLLKSQNASILILNDFDKPLGLILKLLGWKGKVFTFVRRRPSSFPKMLAFLWIRNSIFSSENVIAVSDVVLNELPKSNKIIRIYNPIEVADNNIDVQYPDFNTVIFLCLGNYMAGKGQQEALDSFILAYKSNKNIRLHFAGGDLGLEKNKIFKRCLMEKVEKLNLEGVITFDGYVDHIEKIIYQSHVILNFSVSESFSRVCVEAASYGRPVIATKSGGPQEIISHGESGFLVDIGDLVSMSKYIKWFSNNPKEIPKMGEIAVDIVNKKFSFYSFKNDINELLLK